jgi:hypothetical protein
MGGGGLEYCSRSDYTPLDNNGNNGWWGWALITKGVRVCVNNFHTKVFLSVSRFEPILWRLSMTRPGLEDHTTS